MKKTPLFSLLMLTLSLSLLVIDVSARAAPVTQATNLLQNPGFEQPYSSGAAQGWQKWNMATEKEDEDCLVAYHYQPKWNVETGSGFVRDGSASQYVGNNWDTWGGGVYQTVPATPGATYRFSFDGRGRGTSESSPAPSDGALQMNMRAGIDPDGSGVGEGGVPDGDIVWGAAGSPHDAWQRFTVEATATGNQITVFTSANWGVTGVNQCRQFLDTWYDAAQLVAQTPPTPVPPTQAPVATAPPAPTGGVPTEPAAATLAATLTVDTPTATGNSSICANAFLDTNGNGIHEADEGYVGGVTLTVAQGSVVTGQGVSTGSETPLCFDNLQVGAYQVAQTLPPSLEMTTQANATVNLGQGQTIGLEFGSRLRQSTDATPTTDPDGSTTPAETGSEATATATSEGEVTGGGAPGWLVILGVAAILIGIALLGGLLFVVLRR
jgi:hypothetical protein